MGGGEGGQGAGQGPGTLFTWPQGAGAGQDGTCSCGAAVSAQAPASALGGSIQQAELQSAKWGCMAVPPGTSCTMGCSSQTGSTPSWASLQYNNATGRWWRSHHPPLLALQRPRQRPGTTQAPPRRHPGATQASPRRHPGTTQAPLRHQPGHHPGHHPGTSQGTSKGAHLGSQRWVLAATPCDARTRALQPAGRGAGGSDMAMESGAWGSFARRMGEGKAGGRGEGARRGTCCVVNLWDLTDDQPIFTIALRPSACRTRGKHAAGGGVVGTEGQHSRRGGRCCQRPKVQAGGQAGRRAGRQAGRQAGRRKAAVRADVPHGRRTAPGLYRWRWAGSPGTSMKKPSVAAVTSCRGAARRTKRAMSCSQSWWMACCCALQPAGR